MKIFGHPLHVILIHFPTALLPMDLVCSVLSHNMNKPSLIDAAFFAMIGGVVFGWLAIVTGTFDLLKVADEKPDLLKKVLVHGGINALVLSGYSIIFFLRYKSYPDLEPDNNLLLITKGTLVLILFLGNFLGGRLILKYKIGVEKCARISRDI
jgi:uncharacterized membrane protein